MTFHEFCDRHPALNKLWDEDVPATHGRLSDPDDPVYRKVQAEWDAHSANPANASDQGEVAGE